MTHVTLSSCKFLYVEIRKDVDNWLLFRNRREHFSSLGVKGLKRNIHWCHRRGWVHHPWPHDAFLLSVSCLIVFVWLIVFVCLCRVDRSVGLPPLLIGKVEGDRPTSPIFTEAQQFVLSDVKNYFKSFFKVSDTPLTRSIVPCRQKYYISHSMKNSAFHSWFKLKDTLNSHHLTYYLVGRI